MSSEIVDGLAIEENETEGRFYVAARDFQPGDIIIECLPATVGWAQAYTDRCCHWCLRVLPTNRQFNVDLTRGVVPCERCHVAYYCNRRCAGDALPFHTEQTSECLVLRHLHYEQQGHLGDYCASQFEELDNATVSQALVHALMPKEKQPQLCLMPIPVCSEEEEQMLAPLCTPLGVSTAELRQWCSRQLCNEFALEYVKRGNMKRYGSACYVPPSLFNHSCEPNVTYVRVNRTYVYFAVAPIAAGDKMTISYIDGDLETRHETLAESYGFQCRCTFDGKSTVFQCCRRCGTNSVILSACAMCDPEKLYSRLKKIEGANRQN